MGDIWRRWKVGRGRIPDVRHSDGMTAQRNSGCEIPGWNGGGEGFRV